MLKWALVFLLLSLVAGGVGFGGAGGAFVGLANFIFFLGFSFVILFVVLSDTQHKETLPRWHGRR
jgi:uncharacterized membrane protein YtjA (UPF0391 family)